MQAKSDQVRQVLPAEPPDLTIRWERVSCRSAMIRRATEQRALKTSCQPGSTDVAS